MSILRKLFALLGDEAGQQQHLEKMANREREEIEKIADAEFGTFEGYSETFRRFIGLEKRKGRLLWCVSYALYDENGLPMKGGHTIYEIDDETGEIIKTFNSPY